MGRRAGGAGRQRTIPRPPDLTAAPARTCEFMFPAALANRSATKREHASQRTDCQTDAYLYIAAVRQCVAARRVVGDGERAVAVIVRGRQAVEWVGQPPLTAVCHGERERRLPATQGGGWPAAGYRVQRTSAAVTRQGTDSSCGARPVGCQKSACPVTCCDGRGQPYGIMITVSLRLLYLIFIRALRLAGPARSFIRLQGR
jgi:hypothetical protein